MIQIQLGKEELQAMIAEHVRRTEGLEISDPARLKLSIDHIAYDSHGEIVLTAALQPKK